MPNVDWFRGDQLVGVICLLGQEVPAGRASERGPLKHRLAIFVQDRVSQFLEPRPIVDTLKGRAAAARPEPFRSPYLSAVAVVMPT
jgi:hypothetical protein